MQYRFFIKEGTHNYLKVNDVEGYESRQFYSHSKLANFWQNYRYLVCILVNIEIHGLSVGKLNKPFFFLKIKILQIEKNKFEKSFFM